MKCPYQYDVKVEPSNGCGMKNDGFKSETDDNSLERGVSPPDFNEKGSLEMKCPYQYDVKVEPSNGCGMKNDGFKSETDDNSLERGVSPPDFNEKGSLEITNGGQDVHYHNGNADIKKGLPV